MFPIISLWDCFSDAQGQRTPQLLVESGRNSNSSEILWLSSLPARMKKFRPKIKVARVLTRFPHYKPMGAIGCH